jgi:membrane protein DedA with SNARE-associated domain
MPADGGTNDATSGIGAVVGVLTLALMTGGTIMYLAGYIVIEDILAYFK